MEGGIEPRVPSRVSAPQSRPSSSETSSEEHLVCYHELVPRARISEALVGGDGFPVL